MDRRRQSRSTIAQVLGAALIVGAMVMAIAAPPVMAAGSTVAEIVAKMPAYDPATGQPALEQILKLGPDGLKELCSLVTPPQQTDDAGARYALHGLVLYTKRPGAEADRANVEKALLDALAAAKDPDLKVFFIEQLQLTAGDTAVDAIGALMVQEKLCDPATQALTRMGTPKCVGLIRGALPAAKGKRLVTIVQALGVLADKPSAKAILPYAASKDQTLRRTAWCALANIGDASACKALQAASQSTERYERALGTKYYLLLAARLGENGDKQSAANICRELLKTRTDPADGNVVCAALYVLHKTVGAEAADELLAAIDGKNAYVRQAAMNILPRVEGAAVTKMLIGKAGTATGPAKAALISILGLRGDKSAVPAVMAAMDDKDPAVAGAAMQAAARLAPSDVLKLLTARMKSTDPVSVTAARTVLAGLKVDGFNDTLAAAMADASAPGKVALLELLAARGAKAQSKVVFDALADSDQAVRQAAARALPAVTVPTDIGRVLTQTLATTDQRQQTAMQAVVVLLARKGSAKPVLDALAKADATQRPLLLGMLARIGGTDGLAAVTRDLASSDAKTADAAARALADWQGTEAIEPLLKLAGQTDNKVHSVLALRGIVRLVGRDTTIPADKAVAILGKALAAAKMPAEKNLVIGAAGGIRTIEALKLVGSCLDDAALREVAAVAAVKIACPARRQKGLTGPVVKEALGKVVAVSKNARAVEQASKYLKSMPAGK